MPYTAHLEIEGVTVLTGSWSHGCKPVWTVYDKLSDQYRNTTHEIIDQSWREIGGQHTPHELGAMITCLEYVSTKLAIRLVVPKETREKLYSLSALAS